MCLLIGGSVAVILHFCTKYPASRFKLVVRFAHSKEARFGPSKKIFPSFCQLVDNGNKQLINMVYLLPH